MHENDGSLDKQKERFNREPFLRYGGFGLGLDVYEAIDRTEWLMVLGVGTRKFYEDFVDLNDLLTTLRDYLPAITARRL